MQHENEKRNEQSNKGAKDQSSSNSTVLYRFIIILAFSFLLFKRSLFHIVTALY